MSGEPTAADVAAFQKGYAGAGTVGRVDLARAFAEEMYRRGLEAGRNDLEAWLRDEQLVG